MSVYGYLVCHDCRQKLWLGKACGEPGEGRVSYYHIGSEREPPHWQRELLNTVLWKFVADHTSHRVRILLEQEMEDEQCGYRSLGGDAVDDLSWGEYVEGWPGGSAGSGTGGR